MSPARTKKRKTTGRTELEIIKNKIVLLFVRDSEGLRRQGSRHVLEKVTLTVQESLRVLEKVTAKVQMGRQVLKSGSERVQKGRQVLESGSDR